RAAIIRERCPRPQNCANALRPRHGNRLEFELNRRPIQSRKKADSVRRIRAGMTESTKLKPSPSAVRGRIASFVMAMSMIGATVGLSACNTSTEGTKDAYADEEPAGNLYNKGLAYMNAGKLTDAVKS